MLVDWNARQNLVSQASLAQLWSRHMWDSAQLADLVPARAKSLADLGSGAGFPGLVLATLFREGGGPRVVLFEATAKKCRFLEAVASRLQLPVDIRNTRLETTQATGFDVITARACAPLPKLLNYAQRFWRPNTTALFLKGRNLDHELTESLKSWRMVVDQHGSRSDPAGVILEIRELCPVLPTRPQNRN
jgi:16S rRNA (guanine527-N7)-methyltransferase